MGGRQTTLINRDMNTCHWSTRKEAINSGWDSPELGWAWGESLSLLDGAGRRGDSGRGNPLSCEHIQSFWGTVSGPEIKREIIL